jgi:organic hydroperoxide reductase OsmC/OhrA
MSIEKVTYRAHAKVTGGRDGRAVSSDNVLDLKLTVPREMGGAGEVARQANGLINAQVGSSQAP